MRSRHATVTTSALVAVLVLAAAACGDDEGSSGPVPDPDPPAATAPGTEAPATPGPGPELDLDGREFVATSVEGHDLVEGTTLRIAFTDGTLTASAGCNTLTAEYTVDDDATLLARSFTSTEMGCETELLAQDRWVNDVLALEPRITLDDGTLTFDGVAGSRIVLTDARDEPGDDTPLTGTRWVLDGIRTQDVVETVPDGVTAAVTFTDDGQMEVEAGCNSGSAAVEIGDDDTLTFGPLTLTRMMCEPDVMRVERAVTAVLADDVTVAYSIDGDRLTLDTLDEPDGGNGSVPGDATGAGLLFVADG